MQIEILRGDIGIVFACFSFVYHSEEILRVTKVRNCIFRKSSHMLFYFRNL